MNRIEELFSAVKGSDLIRVRELIEADPDLLEARSPEGLSPLMIALYFGQTGIGDFLLSQMFEVSFFEAVALGRADYVEQLIRNSEECVSEFTPDGFTGLHLAAFFGQGEVVNVLLDYGANPNAVATGTTDVCPIHSAAAGRRPDSIVPIVQALLTYGARIDATQSGGFTALHAAAHSGNRALVRLLLEKGANAELRTDEGKTALDLAIEKADSVCIDLLNQYLD
jgi:ankyrin repeat protein